ncbi:hypothetical protein KCU85_g2152, partial [Aureobasidium melanogenum]
MPELHEVSYSREATIAAFRDYYQFLTTMFLPKGRVLEPPVGGWPSITREKVYFLGKNDEVFELMKHLPYLSEEALLAPYAEVADWPFMVDVSFEESDIEGTRVMTDELDWEDIPSSAFGITSGKDYFILDTQFGVVFWDGAPGEVADTAAREPIVGDFFDCTPENEHGWRCNKAWAIADFFEVLKNRYRILKYLPLHEYRIEEWFDQYEDGDGPNGNYPFLRAIRRVYKEHGWPDPSVYKKQECMDALQKMIEESFPEQNF